MNTSTEGTEHCLCWDSRADVGDVYISGVAFKIIPIDASGDGIGTPDTTDYFIVDNDHSGW